jgi:hypothetical protein
VPGLVGSRAPTGTFERPALRSVAKPVEGSSASPTAAEKPPAVGPPASPAAPSENSTAPAPAPVSAGPVVASVAAAAQSAPARNERFADLLSEYHQLASLIHLDSHEARHDIVSRQAQSLAILRERREKAAQQQQQLFESQRVERAGIVTQRESELTLLGTMMVSESTSRQTRARLLAEVASALKQREADEGARAERAAEKSARVQQETLGAITASFKDMQEKMLAASTNITNNTNNSRNNSQISVFNAVEFLVNRQRLLLKEETTARDFMEDLQLSFRRQIVGMCTAVFLSPFRQAPRTTVKSEGEEGGGGAEGYVDERNESDRKRIGIVSAAPNNHRQQQNGIGGGNNRILEQSPRSAVADSSPRDMEQPNQHLGHPHSRHSGVLREAASGDFASPPFATRERASPSSSAALTVAAVRAEAESLERSRLLMRFFRKGLGFDLSTASRYSTLFIAAGFAVAVRLEKNSFLTTSEEQSDDDQDHVAAVFEDLTVDDLREIGLTTIGEQRTFLSRLRGRRERKGSEMSPPMRHGGEEKEIKELQPQKGKGANSPSYDRGGGGRHDVGNGGSASPPRTYAPGLGDQEYSSANEDYHHQLRFDRDNRGTAVSTSSPSPLRPRPDQLSDTPICDPEPVRIESPAASIAPPSSHASLTMQDLEDYLDECKARMGRYDHAIHQRWDDVSRYRRHEPDEPLWQAEWRRACIADLKDESSWESSLAGFRRRMIAAASLGERITRDDLPVPYAGRSNSARGVVVQQRASGVRCPRRL